MVSNLESDQVRVHQALGLAEEIERYKGLVQALSDTVEAKVSYIDSEQRYQYVNKQYEEWYQTTSDKLVGKTVQELMGEDYQYVKQHLDSALSGKEVRYGFILNFPDGQQRYLWITYVPHVNELSEVKGIFVICQDITIEQKRLEESLEQIKATEA